MSTVDKKYYRTIVYIYEYVTINNIPIIIHYFVQYPFVFDKIILFIRLPILSICFINDVDRECSQCLKNSSLKLFVRLTGDVLCYCLCIELRFHKMEYILNRISIRRTCMNFKHFCLNLGKGCHSDFACLVWAIGLMHNDVTILDALEECWSL